MALDRLRALLDLVDDSRAGDRGELIPQSFLEDLPHVIGCDAASFEVIDPYAQEMSVQEGEPSVRIGLQSDLWWNAFWEACSYPQRTGDFATVWTDGRPLPWTVNGPRWRAFDETLDWHPRHHAVMSLAPQGARDRRLLLWRESGSGFDDLDLAALALMRPHLERLVLKHQREPEVEALTPRQQEIVRLLASGRTNRQIARTLGLSEGTVRKHLENIFRRLGAANRAEAVARLAVPSPQSADGTRRR